MEIIDSLRFKDIGQIRIIESEIKERRNDIVTRLELYFDIVDFGPVPITTVLDNLKKYWGSEEDVFHYWPVDSLNVGIERIKNLCGSLGLIFSDELEHPLRRAADDRHRLYLIAIERPFY